MQTRGRSIFATIRSEGALLPTDLLQRVINGDRNLPGVTSDAYHLNAGEKLNEATNRAWNRLVGAWSAFTEAAAKLPASDPGTTLTRERWLLPLFSELGYGRLLTTKALEIDGKTYPVSHGWQHTPMHLVGCRVDLDRRAAGVAGASRSSPHGLVQELLNRSDAHLWGMVSNGLLLRILRDNSSLTRQAYVEFDLEAMMTGEVYADFVLLWLMCHESRVEAERPETCWLEQWSKAAQEQGTRALDQLRKGVEEAITNLGRGFLVHPANQGLRDSLRYGTLEAQEYYRQLLRLVYRLLFLFVAEDRDLLCTPHANPAARERYTRFYSTARLRRLAERRVGTRHADLFHGLRLVMQKLRGDGGCPELALPALGSLLFSDQAIPALDLCEIVNHDLLDAIRALAFSIDGNSRRIVDYKNLGSEELGSVYESLLELHPVLHLDAGTFELKTAGGHERKTTGSYYTPTSLIQCLLDSALDPVLEEAARQDNPEAAILKLKICDPACGSGHFLIAAAHRVAKRLAAIRTGDEEPSPEATRTALRDVIGHCIHGVDLNPMAVELCKVSLWMEALEPGKPLSFLDHRIQCGNSLLGATPALLVQGIPDEAFDPIEGDDKDLCKKFKKQNKEERGEGVVKRGEGRVRGQMPLFDAADQPWQRLGDLASGLLSLAEIPDDTIEGIRRKQERYEELVRSSGYLYGRLWADVWCAAFVWKKTKEFPYPITEEAFRRIERNPFSVAPWMRDEIQRLARQYQFFHWHLAFPDIFYIPTDCEKSENEQAGWGGGFNVVLGNPPWVRQEKLKAVKNLLSVYKSFKSTADLSIFFLDLSMTITRMKGRIGMLTPNKWFRTDYGEPLRRIISQLARVHLVIDFGHSRDLFPDADTFPAAIVLERRQLPPESSEEFKFVRATDEDRREQPLLSLVQNQAIKVSHGNLGATSWQLEDNSISGLLTRLLASGVSLTKYVGQPPLYGLKTGLNKAFYIDSATRQTLIAEDPLCEPLLKKFLRGRDIQRWNCKWAGQWHIVIPSSQNHPWPWSSATNEQEAEGIFANTYPSLHQHLKQFQGELKGRADKGQFWWELRACDYYKEFEKSKIVLADITWHSEFALDTVPAFLNNTCYLIPSTNLYLLAILNSRVMWWILHRVAQQGKDGALRLIFSALDRLPIPIATPELATRITKEVEKIFKLLSCGNTDRALLLSLEQSLNAMVEEAFSLEEDERNILLRSLPPRDPLRSLEQQVSDNISALAEA